MAALSHFPNFFSFSPRKPFALPLPSISTEHYLLHRWNYPRRHPRISASSINKPRAGRKGRINADLCNEIRQFVSAVGLPEGHVPSLKELSQHGRQDLANIVRRRGYKLIKELLATSAKSDKKGSDVGEGLREKQNISVLKGHDEKVEDTDEVVFWSSEVSVKQNHLDSADESNTDCAFSSDSKSCMVIESLTNSSFQEKVAKFIQDGELDEIEDDGGDILNEIGPANGNGFVELENITKESSALGVVNRSDTAKIMNGNISSPKQDLLPASGNITPRDYNFSSEGLLGAGCDEELEVEHQKELELSWLKEQIEKEKLALSILQTKAEKEISEAQKLIMEKDAELRSTEESLSGLEEVQIQYWGDGETVEVSGSFNGWHHQIMMDPQTSSSILDPTGARLSKGWTTVLWLYPGIYEIKFIVDGHWRIDPQRDCNEGFHTKQHSAC